AAREQLHDEIELERQHLQAQLQTSIAQEQEKARAIAAQQQQERQRQYEQQALQNSLRFTSKLLGELASAELESRLLDKLLAQLQAMPESQRKSLSQALNGHEVTTRVQTAFSLDEPQREKLRQALQGLSEQPLRCEFKQNPDLLAGARIELGPWLLHANLEDELQVFAEFEHNTPLPTHYE
ncbi:MAG: F0F1 ATP synthase subunit delta, partial [Gammaproteobacteria bacterium]